MRLLPRWWAGGVLSIDTKQWESFPAGESAKCPAGPQRCNVLGDYNGAAGTLTELTFPFVTVKGSQDQSFVDVAP